MNSFEWVGYKELFKKKAVAARKTEEYISNNLAYAECLFSRGLPIIFDVKHLSLLVGIKAEYLYKVSNDSKLFYRKFLIKKKNGKKRSIHEPFPNLKVVQNWILNNLLYCIEPSQFAKAYIPNVSIRDNVRFHKGQKQVLKLDITNFFESISEKYVYKIFKKVGYTDALSVMLSKLCTLKGSLPQGASTSSYISNLVLNDFDRAISSYCLERKIRYTRYADDLTFSGNFDSKSLINIVSFKLKSLGLSLNKEKTRLLKQNQSQMVTGIVVNEKIQVSQKYRKKIRLEMYYIKKYGLYSHMSKSCIKGDGKNYLKSLKGRIDYCLFINQKDLEMKKYSESVRLISKELFDS
ncbi:reverse transcriptase family protein [Enterococcus nangangensis]